MKKLVVIAFLSLLLVGFVFAGDFNIRYGGNKIFTVATNGTVLAMNVSLSGFLSSVGNITTSEYFVGSGKYLTEVSTYNATYADYATNVSKNYTKIVYDNWNTDWLSTYNATYESYATDGVTIKYQNISNIPTCGAGEHLDYDGSALTCTADSGGDFTNVAYYNETQTWAEEQQFTKYVNITQGIRLMTNTSVITRDGTETTNISIDSSGNVNIYLG